MKALVLGCGEMGKVAISDLYEFGEFDEIVIGSRSIDKADQVISDLEDGFANVTAEVIDVEDNVRLVAMMKDCDVVLNCVGPNYKYELPIAEAAIQAKVSLVDLNDEYETTLKMLELDDRAREAGIAIILGLGASPGINNILARAGAEELDVVEEIHTAWIMSGSDPGGLALSYHLLYSLSGRALTYADGKLVEVQSFVDGKERLEFPKPIGAIDVFHIGHPEPITLSRCFNGIKYVDDKASFNPPFINDLIVDLGRMVRNADGPIRVGDKWIDAMDFAASFLRSKCKSLRGVPKEGGLRVEVKGIKANKKTRMIYSSAGRIGHGTGMSASIGAQMIADGRIKQTGVLTPEECIDPAVFLQEIICRGIGDLKTEKITE